MDETALAASYPVAPPPAAGEPSPEQRAADAVAAYLGTGKTAPAEPAAPVPPAGVKEEPPASSPEQQPEPLAPVEPYQLDVPDGTPSEIATEENIAVLNGFSAAASRAGLARPVAESLLDIYTDAQSIFRYGEPGPFSTGDEYTRRTQRASCSASGATTMRRTSTRSARPSTRCPGSRTGSMTARWGTARARSSRSACCPT